jgi:hypothetical protein
MRIGAIALEITFLERRVPDLSNDATKNSSQRAGVHGITGEEDYG